MIERDELIRNKRQLELEIERTLRSIGSELLVFGRESNDSNEPSCEDEHVVAPDSRLWRLLDSELPELHNKLSRVVAELDGLSSQRALAKVLAWQRPLVQRLVRPSLRRLMGPESRMLEADRATVDATGQGEN